MSNEMDDATPKPTVSYEDAVQFLLKRAPNACPACGYEKWAVSAPNLNGDAHIAQGFAWVNEDNGNIYMKGTPLLTATCRKCAFMKVHNLKVIAKWVKDGKPEFAE